jgi:predicted Zn-ribbon and HTH transcriptional regulator
VAHCPASAGRPRFEIADIVRAHRAELEQTHHLSLQKRRVLCAIELCRTAALGGHLDVCRHCGFEQPAYNSCRNRHCPKCQALVQEKWIAARSERVLGVGHFHVVFTLPSELRPLTQALPKLMFDALFRAASETLLELGHSRLGGLLGVTMILHTWTRDLRIHPHVHAIVSAGVLDTQGAWRPTSIKYLFPAEVLAQVFRGKMLDLLHRMHTRGRLQRHRAFDDPQAFDHLTAQLANQRWCVYAKRPFRRADHLLGYLGRYTHRVAIANSRLVDVQHDRVTFRTKNGQTQTLAPVEFLRRFVQHVLPNGFKKIRHFGLYASSHGALLQSARSQILGPGSAAKAVARSSWVETLRVLTGRDVTRCPRCGSELERLPLPERAARAPPKVAA